MGEKIAVENVNHPGKTTNVDAEKYNATKAAFLKGLPKSPPGLTQAEAKEAIRPYMPEHLFPGGDKIGWWQKCVQLDLEAKGILVRENSKPLRWHLA